MSDWTWPTAVYFVHSYYAASRGVASIAQFIRLSNKSNNRRIKACVHTISPPVDGRGISI